MRAAFFWASLVVGFSFLLISLVSGEIKVGVVSCLSGGLSTFGISSVQGTKLAAEEINSAGGILRQPLTLIIDDNQSRSGETARIVRKFLTQDRVVAILGDLTSSLTMEAAPLAQNAHVPLLTPTATNVAITPIGDFVFRSCFTDPFTGRVMARFALDHLHARRAVIMTDIKQDYSVGVAAELKQYFGANGGLLVEDLSFSSGDTDFRAQLSKLKAVRPEVVFLPAYYPEVSLILREARLLGVTAPFVGGEGWDSPALVQIAGKSADGSYYANHFSSRDPDPRVQQFVARYEERYHAVPDALAALWYDGMRLMVDAIERAGSDNPEKIRDALAQTKDFSGVTGNISLDGQRNATKPGVIVTIQAGTIKMVERVNP
ncbi:MAG: branched-chain amino acid transport system substrate-binding protein [Verrucomicrobiota bacterium]|jgi:branched-chain amino acid transport system substrate-binding protein